MAVFDVMIQKASENVLHVSSLQILRKGLASQVRSVLEGVPATHSLQDLRTTLTQASDPSTHVHLIENKTPKFDLAYREKEGSSAADSRWHDILPSSCRVSLPS